MAQKFHIPNIVGLDECDLVAIAEVRDDIREAVADRYQVPKRYRFHLDLAEDPAIEAVMVSGGLSGQGDIAIDLLQAGKHVLIEKPMATSIEQADRILDAERSNHEGARLMIAYMKRFDPGYAFVKDLLADLDLRGALGDLVLVRTHSFGGEWIAGLDTSLFESAATPPLSDMHYPDWLPEGLRDGYVRYLAQDRHDVNLLRWLLGMTTLPVRHVDLSDDLFTGVVIFDAAQTRVILETGRSEVNTWDEQIYCYFAQGCISTSTRPMGLRNQPVDVTLSRLLNGVSSVQSFTPTSWQWSYREEIRHFARAVRIGEPFLTSGSDARNDIETFEQIFRFVVRHKGAGN